jgi:hypothetical protein
MNVSKEYHISYSPNNRWSGYHYRGGRQQPRQLGGPSKSAIQRQRKKRHGSTEKNHDWESEVVNYVNQLQRGCAACYFYLRAAKNIYDLCFVAIFVTVNVK